MDSNETSWIISRMAGNNSTHLNNNAESANSIYVFTPAAYNAKRALFFVQAFIGGMGFLGNCLISYFLWQKPTTNPIRSNRFIRNLNMYGKSISLSDLLSCGVSLPLVSIQMSFDVFQSGWPCRIVRYFNFLFPVITMNNLVVISLEKYLSTRSVPRTFSVSTVKKMIISAWLFGIVVMLFPAAAFNGIRVNLDNTHYTVLCRNYEHFYPFQLTIIIFPIQFVLPAVFIIYINACLLKTVWTRERRRIASDANNAFKAHLRATRIKGTTLIIALTFAFIIPYWFFIANVAYTQIAKPQRDFSTDYLMRYGTGSVVYLCPVINFIIYVAQMKDFREFLNKLLCRKNYESRQPEVPTRKKKVNCIAPQERQDAARKQDNTIDIKLL